MTKYTDNEYPANWHGGTGEASRPLHEDGYYLHLYYRVLPGSNQHVERFLELRVDTAGMPPADHVLELSHCTEDGEEVRRVETLSMDTIDVPYEERYTEEGQEKAEEAAEERAVELMEEYADWTPA